jgi:hypothetical protein
MSMGERVLAEVRASLHGEPYLGRHADGGPKARQTDRTDA